MNNLRVKKKEGHLFALLNDNYNTENVVCVELSKAEISQGKARQKNVKHTATVKIAALRQKEKIENTYNSSIDSKDNKQAKKLAFLKKIGRR
jgi:hypothetical protein